MENVIDKVGIEDEYLITDTQGRIPERERIEQLFLSLNDIGWKGGDHFVFEKDGYVLTQDSGYALMELISPPYSSGSLDSFYTERKRITLELIEHFSKQGYCLLAGCTPENIPEAMLDQYVTPGKPRQEAAIFLNPYSEHYRYFGPANHYNFSFTDEKALIDSLNIMNQLSGFLVLLGARQKLWLGKEHPYQSVREYTWHVNGKHMGCPERMNFMPFKASSIDHYLYEVLKQRVLFLEHNGETFVPDRRISFQEFCLEPKEICDQRTKQSVRVQLDSENDLNYFLKCFWWNVRLKKYQSTFVLEVRSFDTQKFEDAHEVLRLLKHIIDHRSEFLKLVDSKSFMYWRKLYWTAIEHGFNSENVKKEFGNFTHILSKQHFEFVGALKFVAQNHKTQADYICEEFAYVSMSRVLQELSVGLGEKRFKEYGTIINQVKKYLGKLRIKGNTPLKARESEYVLVD